MTCNHLPIDSEVLFWFCKISLDETERAMANGEKAEEDPGSRNHSQDEI